MRSSRYALFLAALTALWLLASCAAFADFAFVQVSDTHIDSDPKDTAFEMRLEQTVEQINELNPAFVILTGDVVTTFTADNYARFKEIVATLKPPLYVIPGNHDVGNKPGRNGPVTEESYNAWLKAGGVGHVAFDREDCLFIGLTSVLFNSGLPAEEEQFDWLKARLEGAGKKRVFVFQHHPIFENSPKEPTGAYNNIDEPMRSQLLKLFKKHKVEAVFYGHLHRFNESFYGGTKYIGTPSTAFPVTTDRGMSGYRIVYVSPGGFTTYFIDLRKGGEPPSNF